MANPTPKPRNRTSQPGGLRPSPALGAKDPPEVVDPIWLLKALGITIVAALICGYLSLCGLFYQGQWQLVLHPAKALSGTIPGISAEPIRFGVDESGAPQLAGLWIPSEQGGRYSAYTLLYLPSGDGSLAATAQQIAAIHTLGINIFAFDYRGYGQSAPTRPNQSHMTEDAASAWKYLTISRVISPATIIPFGVGVGGALAVQLAAQNGSVPAVVVEDPRPDLLQVVLADPRTKMLPVRALFRERFEITKPLANLTTPKLVLLTAAGSATGSASTQGMVQSAADPKMIATMDQSQRSGPAYLEQINRFLDQYLR